jgi:hypothetical protein
MRAAVANGYKVVFPVACPTDFADVPVSALNIGGA